MVKRLLQGRLRQHVGMGQCSLYLLLATLRGPHAFDHRYRLATARPCCSICEELSIRELTPTPARLTRSVSRGRVRGVKNFDIRVGSEWERVGAIAASTFGLWFAGFNYASPAMLVERGSRTR